MLKSKQVPKWDLITPTEDNGYSMFEKKLEGCNLIFFHVTPKTNFESIIKNGFLSKAKLEGEGLDTVSYARQSSGCLAHINNQASEDLVIFAVEFSTLEDKNIYNNHSDIHVDEKTQPTILGYCEIPKGFRVV